MLKAKTNWKFWTYPRQIQELRTLLERERELNDRLRQLNEHLEEHARRQRGLHRANA